MRDDPAMRIVPAISTQGPFPAVIYPGGVNGTVKPKHGKEGGVHVSMLWNRGSLEASGEGRNPVVKRIMGHT
ncbi:hypothetical protein QCA50_016121 [Cerrena zonata]|uniref:Uncharacterized protein n=1 Tax=Cerrena zonata TaxID=2478898 RepID=A0AAW0FJL8_9APHY